MNVPTLLLMTTETKSWAQAQVINYHYLHRPVDVRTMPEGYQVRLPELGPVGCLLFGRPEATRCYPWYGSVDDVDTGRAEVTRWQVLNLSRVWFDPMVQAGGGKYYCAERLPGYVDRSGVWRSTLASTAIRQALGRIGYDYLLRRPPCFLEEPYEIRWLLSYCDSRRHRGVLYAAAGFELYRTNRTGMQTWRLRLPDLAPDQNAAVRRAALADARSQRKRADRERAALQLAFGE